MSSFAGLRVGNLDDVGAAAVQAGVAAQKRDPAFEAQPATAVIEKCLPRGKTAEEFGLAAVFIDQHARAPQPRGRVIHVRPFPASLEFARPVNENVRLHRPWSPLMLARLQEQCGWTSMTKVHAPSVRGTLLRTGHDEWAMAAWPGVLSKLRMA
jgi:hypothetical protein